MSKLIPDGWNLARLDEYVEKFLVPMRDKPKNFTGSIPWVRIEDFDGKYLAKSKSFRCVDEDTVSAMKLKVYPVGTVLCSCSARLGVCTIAARELVSNQTFIGLVPGKRILSEYLYYRMQFHADDLQRLSSGTTIAYLPRAKFEEFEVLVPPLPEQQKIAKILTSVDEVIEKTQAQIDKLKDLKTGMMQELLTKGVGEDGKPHTEFKDSPVGRIPKGWEVLELDSLVTDPICYGIVQVGQYTEGGIPVMAIKNLGYSFSEGINLVNRDIEKKYARSRISEGDLLISVKATVGRVDVVPKGFSGNISRDIARIRFGGKVKSEFAKYFFQSSYGLALIAETSVGTTRAELSIHAVKKMSIPVPSLKEQNILIDSIRSIDNRKMSVQKKLECLRNTKKALMQDLLTGKVRVQVD